jgi:hypothetical protein
MANLTQTEFHRAIELLADVLGLQRLRDRFVRYNALVTRRKVASAATLADQIYMLSGGLRRQVPATYAFHAVWSEHLNSKLGEDGEKDLEKLAETVNACLRADDTVDPDKAAALDAALATYEQALSAAVGPQVARVDMVMKAVPDIAEKLRAAPIPLPVPPPAPDAS